MIRTAKSVLRHRTPQPLIKHGMGEVAAVAMVAAMRVVAVMAASSWASLLHRGQALLPTLLGLIHTQGQARRLTLPVVLQRRTAPRSVLTRLVLL
jgi:hypothetical protein